MREPIKEKEPWDRKKILLGVFVLLGVFLIFYTAKTVFIDSEQNSATTVKSVKGAETTKDQKQTSNLNGIGVSQINDGLQNQVNSIKTDVNNINVQEVASSSPQIQKVLNDIKSIQNYPSNQAKDACVKICNQL